MNRREHIVSTFPAYWIPTIAEREHAFSNGPLRKPIGGKSNLQAPDRVGSHGETAEEKTEPGDHLGGGHNCGRQHRRCDNSASLSLAGGQQ